MGKSEKNMIIFAIQITALYRMHRTWIYSRICTTPYENTQNKLFESIDSINLSYFISPHDTRQWIKIIPSPIDGFRWHDKLSATNRSRMAQKPCRCKGDEEKSPQKPNDCGGHNEHTRKCQFIWFGVRFRTPIRLILFNIEAERDTKKSISMKMLHTLLGVAVDVQFFVFYFPCILLFESNVIILKRLKSLRIILHILQLRMLNCPSRT